MTNKIVSCKIKPGELVIVSHWPDLDSKDHAFISTLDQIIITERRTYFKVHGSERMWMYVSRITEEESIEVLSKWKVNY